MTMKCRICGRDVQPPRRAYCCDACAREGKKRQKRVENPRRSPGGKLYISRICPECGAEYTGHIKSKRCPDCQAEAYRRANVEYKQRIARGHTRKLGSTDLCETCGEPYIVNSGKQRYCKKCAGMAILKNTRRHKREWNKNYYSDTQKREKRNSIRRKNWQTERKCAICGSAYIPDTPLRKFCSDACRTINVHNLQKIADAKRRPKNTNKEEDRV